MHTFFFEWTLNIVYNYHVWLLFIHAFSWILFCIWCWVWCLWADIFLLLFSYNFYLEPFPFFFLLGQWSLSIQDCWFTINNVLFWCTCSSADIWSVGCTVIEMVTGKPPWHQQYQEVCLEGNLQKLFTFCANFPYNLQQQYYLWSSQFVDPLSPTPQVAAFFYYIGTTKEHPPIPENLSAEAKDFLLKCLQKYVSEIY